MKTKLEDKVIVFLSKKEHEEAARLGVVNPLPQLSLRYPQIRWESPQNIEEFQDNYNNEWNSPKYIKLLQRSVMWTGIRDDYKPKAWYELEENIGKCIAVRDDETKEWEYKIFKGYDIRYTYPYFTELSAWIFARPLTNEDIALQGATPE